MTIYRQDLDALVGGSADSAISKMRRQKRFDSFVLRHSKDRSDHYDKRGRLMRPGSQLPEAYPTSMSATPIRCDNKALVQHATWLLPQPTICGSFEAHAGQSAAERVNFYTMLDQMLNLAKNDKDRDFIYVLSHHHPCPRSVLAADMSKVSDRAQGVFLDFFRRLQKGWPLSEEHHKTELARTFSSCRYTELRHWLRAVRRHRRPGEDMQRFDLVLHGIPLNIRFGLAQIFVQEIYPKIRLVEGGIEQVDAEAVAAYVDQIGSRVDQLLATPMSNT